ncbi:FadR/GntR family transcriptional regulator [Arthrobacter sp. FW306-04-A]|uniref:FadR/GntR family transcriptional regulator n=1 Tax=Arthrobacter sp. FW306-04-A TaxID=2879619 RepID=UPI0037BE8634|nr:FCD domain-containing protein [Arthrobacter sp. FW306-04-A]
MKTPKAESTADLHSVLVENLGLAIAEGTLAAHSILRLDELEAQQKVSRSVVREATRVLCSMGMLESRRRLGTVVQPEESWNLYDPQVIRWRLASSKRLEQLQALNELRGAIEPQAARLAAGRVSLDAGSDLVSQAARLWAAGHSGNQDEFLRLDIEFHASVLRASGNPMFTQLHNLVREVLTGRAQHGLMPNLPHHEALQLHVDVASAIQRGEAETAHAAMSRIVEQSTEEAADIWSEHHATRQPSPDPHVAPNTAS